MIGSLQTRLMLSGCAAALAYSPVLAQTAGAPAQGAAQPDQAGAGIGEIVVTAQRRSENIQKVPIAVTALNSQLLNERNITAIEDLANVVPGLKFGEFAGAANITIRGVGTAYISGTGQSSVAVYTDGVYLSQIRSFEMGQGDVGSVEVLEGPQGTLYGRNSTGGVVNYTSAKPTDTLSFGGAINVGNYAELREKAYVSGPISDSVRIRIYGDHEKRDGWTISDATGEKLNGTDNFGGRVSIDADVASYWQSDLRVSFFKDNYTGPTFDGIYPPFAVIPAPYNDFDPYRTNTPVHVGSFRSNIVVSWKNIFDLSPHVKLSSTTGYNHFQAAEFVDSLSNTLAPDVGHQHHKTDAFTQEFNLSGDAPRLKWITGVFLYDHTDRFNARFDETNLFAPLLGLPRPDPLHLDVEPQAVSVIEYNDTRLNEKSASVFGDATYTVFDRTRIYGGARLTYDSVKQGLTQGTGFFAPPDFTCTAEADPQSVNKTSVTGRAGVQQDVTDSAMAYVQYSHGFKAPGFSASKCGNNYQAETIDAIEVGFKSQWFDKRLTFNAAGFYYFYKDQQLEIVDPTGATIVNVPKSHILGVEANVVAQVLPDIHFDISLVLLHAVYDQFINQDPTNGGALGLNLAGNQLDNSPNAAATIGGEYRHTWAGFGQLSFRAEASLTTSYHLRELNEPYTVQPGYAMANLYASYTSPDDHYTIRAFAKNLNNVPVLVGELGFGGALGSYGPPRTFGAEFAVNFR